MLLRLGAEGSAPEGGAEGKGEGSAHLREVQRERGEGSAHLMEV